MAGEALLGPDGKPLSKVTDVVPKELHGFKVTLGMGPYPPDAPDSHRRAVYAELVPDDPAVVKRMKDAGKERILGWVPITVEAAQELRLSPPGSRLAEELCAAALLQAARLAKTVQESAGGLARPREAD